jgi:predicted aldo/keto reductase-like oxidoreductase
MEVNMSKSTGIKRRDFLRNTALGVVGAGVATQTARASLIAGEESGPAMPRVRAYRPLGQTGFKAADIGLGGMAKVEVIRAMLDAGVNYIDTAETYSRGQSEISIGQAIKGRERKSLFINTKLHIKEDESKASILARAHKCLERLDTEYIDCLMTHNPSTVKMVGYEPFHQVCRQLQKEGKVRFVGISSHGSQHGGEQDSMDQVLLAAARDGRFAVMLMVYNFIQRERAEKVLKVCQDKKIGVTLMKTNPVGRYLAMKARVEAMKNDKGRDPERLKRMQNYFNDLKKSADEGEWFIKKYNLSDPAEIRIAATRFGLSHPAVNAVLARADSFEDVEQFLQASGTTLSDMEAKKLAAYTRGPGKLYCRHACGLCEASCPHQVPVNTIMRYNHYFEAQGQEKYAVQKYMALNTRQADVCDQCSGPCQAHCPYGVPIQGLLTMAHQNLTLTPA